MTRTSRLFFSQCDKRSVSYGIVAIRFVSSLRHKNVGKTGHTLFLLMSMTPGHNGWRGPVDSFSNIPSLKSHMKLYQLSIILFCLETLKCGKTGHTLFLLMSMTPGHNRSRGPVDSFSNIVYLFYNLFILIRLRMTKNALMYLNQL